MLAVAFFALVGVIIVGGIAYGVGHVDGMREGWQQGLAQGRAECADHLDRSLAAARRTWAASQRVVPCDPPPFDWAQLESRSRRRAGESRCERG